jgi:hypothetical protein
MEMDQKLTILAGPKFHGFIEHVWLWSTMTKLQAFDFVSLFASLISWRELPRMGQANMMLYV